MSLSVSKLVIISSPSGAGKTSISRALINLNQNFRLSISVTTREKRSDEVDAVDYFFKNKDEFKHMIKANEFLEYAKVFDNFYGTPKSYISKHLIEKNNVILDIDWQGARLIKSHKDFEILSIYILPPSINALRDRLISRGMDSDDVINNRMIRAKSEIEHYHEYDHIVINQDFEKTLKNIYAVIMNKEKMIPADKFHNFVGDLLQQEI